MRLRLLAPGLPGGRWLAELPIRLIQPLLPLELAFRKQELAPTEHSPEVIQQLPAAHFIWIGDGEMKPHIATIIAAMNLQNNIHLIGMQRRADIPELMAALDVVFFTSKYEGLPLSLLEAMAAKKIVVASSDKAYGSHKKLPYREDAPLQGNHPYDVSKSCADLIANTYAHTYNLPVCVTRCGNIYGPGDFNFSRDNPAYALVNLPEAIYPGEAQADMIFSTLPVIESKTVFIDHYVSDHIGVLAIFKKN